jgi:hypothetical protein
MYGEDRRLDTSKLPPEPADGWEVTPAYGEPRPPRRYAS